jgi:transposase
MSMLADQVDLVIGVDTHKHTHSAAVVVAGTGAVVAEITVAADPDGYLALFDLAEAHGTLRAWSIEGTGGYGAGLTRFLQEAGELVVELDRPKRAHRRGGEKSDPLDAVRAAREALGRDQLAQPRARGERAALSVLLAARRSAVDGSTIAPDPRPGDRRPRGVSSEVPLEVHAPDGRPGSPDASGRAVGRGDPQHCSGAAVLRRLAKRSRALAEEAREHEADILAIVRTWRPDLLEPVGVGPVVAATVLCAWSHPGRCRN